jgi:transcription antitermination factor NusG
VYLPIVEELRQWSDRKKKVKKALFNGYVFVKTERNKLWDCLQVPGAVKFVHFAGNHATVRDEEIEMIQKRIQFIVHTGNRTKIRFLSQWIGLIPRTFHTRL